VSTVLEKPTEAPAASPVPPETPEPILRPVVACALTSLAAGLMVGGIFGSWAARLLGAVTALGGVGWAAVTVRSKRTTLLQVLVLPIALIIGVATVAPHQNEIGKVIRAAISNGHLLRPPVPFDPGWRPIIAILLFVLGFASAWVGAGLRRPQLAMLPALVVLGFTAISQPAEGEVLAGILGFIPILLALGVLFAGDITSASELTSRFEAKRAIRGAFFVVGAIVLLFVLGRSQFLFPKPVYNPASKPQKPKSIPLSKADDVVLFEISSDKLTGPWRTGVLDVYDGRGWRLPPFDEAKLKKIPSDGVVDSSRKGTLSVTFTVRDLKATPIFPGVAAPVKIDLISKGVPPLYDPRTDTFRVRTGRVNPGTTYRMTTDPYPTAPQFTKAKVAEAESDQLYAPKPPPAVADLLDRAPVNPWDRLDFLRSQLYKVVVASGAGQPVDVPPSKVQDIFAGSHTATPFEIVATEALLARWAGVPARIGFGFDGFNVEKGHKTVRPKNGSSWLEVHFEGFGWQPLIATPKQAKSTLDTDPNAKFDQNIQPSKDVAVEVYVPVELESVKQLYENVRAWALVVLPWVVGVIALYLLWPAGLRALRRSRRRRWASVAGPRARIAVEYAEFRDLAMDLNVGDPYATPLEFLGRVEPDDEHIEFAWLVARALYGDLATVVTADDARIAEEMSQSLRRRLFRGQPFQSRVLAVMSRASLKYPYTTELPSAPLLRLPVLSRSR